MCDNFFMLSPYSKVPYGSKILEKLSEEFHLLVKDLKLHDHEYFFKCFRMTPSIYEILLQYHAPHITHFYEITSWFYFFWYTLLFNIKNLILVHSLEYHVFKMFVSTTTFTPWGLFYLIALHNKKNYCFVYKYIYNETNRLLDLKDRG